MVSPLSKLPKLPNPKDRRGMEYYDAELREKLKTIDEVDDGTTYGKVKQTALNSNEVDLSKAGVKNKTLDNILNTASFEKTSPAQVDYTDYAGAGLESTGLAKKVDSSSLTSYVEMRYPVLFSHATSYPSNLVVATIGNYTGGAQTFTIQYSTNQYATISVDSGSDIGPNTNGQVSKSINSGIETNFSVRIKSDDVAHEAIVGLSVLSFAAASL